MAQSPWRHEVRLLQPPRLHPWVQSQPVRRTKRQEATPPHRRHHGKAQPIAQVHPRTLPVHLPPRRQTGKTIRQQFHLLIPWRQHLLALQRGDAHPSSLIPHHTVGISRLQFVALAVVRHHRHQFRPCVSRLRPSRVPQHREGSIHAPLLCLLEVGLASQRPFKHRLPVPILRGQTKQAVQPHVVQDQTVALPVKDAHATPHLLQVFR